MKTIATLLTCHNRKEKTLKCLKALYEQVFSFDIDLKVFLTDDGCTDGTAEAVCSHFPDVKIIQGDGTLFWNRGMLKAWQEAAKEKFDFYLWLNDDTYLLPDAINKMLVASEKKENKAIFVGTTQESETSQEITFGGRKLPRFKQIISPDEYTPTECDMFNGNIVLIPKHAFETIGFNDSYYRHAFGDFDYGHRARKLGIKMYITPGILGYCYIHRAIPSFQQKQNGLIKRLRLLYSPLGINPFEDFHYQYKFRSLIYSICHVIKLHINVIFFTR